MKLKSPYLVKPHTKVRLANLPTEAGRPGRARPQWTKPPRRTLGRLDELQELLYASQSKPLLVVLQGAWTAARQGRHHPPHLLRR